MVPLFLAAGYDLLVPVAVIFGGTNLGTLSSFTNPFSTIIASNAAGVNWADGLTERVLMFLISTTILIWYLVRYAQKVKKHPSKSLVYRTDGNVMSPYENIKSTAIAEPLSVRTKLLLILFLATFLTMIAGVVWFDWWLLEMSALFLAVSILVAVITKTKREESTIFFTSVEFNFPALFEDEQLYKTMEIDKTKNESDTIFPIFFLFIIMSF